MSNSREDRGKALDQRKPRRVGQEVGKCLGPLLGLLLVREVLEDPKQRPLFDVWNVEFPKKVFLGSKLSPHVEVKFPPVVVGEIFVVCRVFVPTLDDLEVSAKWANVVLKSSELLDQRISLL